MVAGHASDLGLMPSDAKRLYAPNTRTFADLLLSFPGGLSIDRDTAPLREVDL